MYRGNPHQLDAMRPGTKLYGESLLNQNATKVPSFMGNPHQDRNPVSVWNSAKSGWSSGQGDRRQPAVPHPIDTMERGGTPAAPMPTVTGAMPGTIPKDIMEGGRWENPNFPNEPKPFLNPPPEKFWNDGTPLNDPNMMQLLNTGTDQSMYGPLNPSAIQLAELSQKQMGYMQNPLLNPALGGISEEKLWKNVKDMDYVRPWYKPFGKPSQVPAERSEFNDFQKQLQQGGYWAT